MIALQWFTDHLDGKLGKFRATGLARWGFYVDHMLDWFFIASIVIGYGLLLPQGAIFDLLLMLAVCAGFAVHAMLAFAATETFRTTYLRIGPTELRLVIIVFNAYLVRAGFGAMARAPAPRVGDWIRPPAHRDLHHADETVATRAALKAAHQDRRVRSEFG